MTGLKKLLDSYKGVAFLLCLIIVGALVGMERISFAEFVEFILWAYGALATTRMGEEGMKAIGRGKSNGVPLDTALVVEVEQGTVKPESIAKTIKAIKDAATSEPQP